MFDFISANAIFKEISNKAVVTKMWKLVFNQNYTLKINQAYALPFKQIIIFFCIVHAHWYSAYDITGTRKQ